MTPRPPHPQASAAATASAYSSYGDYQPEATTTYYGKANDAILTTTARQYHQKRPQQHMTMPNMGQQPQRWIPNPASDGVNSYHQYHENNQENHQQYQQQMPLPPMQQTPRYSSDYRDTGHGYGEAAPPPSSAALSGSNRATTMQREREQRQRNLRQYM